MQPSLLFAGTERGAFVSFDDGERWQPLQLNLPTAGVNDLLGPRRRPDRRHRRGASLWVLDDVSPLRQLGAAAGAGALLFPPATAYRLVANQNRDTPLPLDEPRTLNPPAGAVLDYLLPAGTSGPVTLEIARCAQGKVVRSFAQRRAARSARRRANISPTTGCRRPGPAADPGHNRFVWDLRGPRPRALEYEYSIAAVPGADTPELPQGLFALPGTYQVRLTVGGRRPLSR